MICVLFLKSYDGFVSEASKHYYYEYFNEYFCHIWKTADSHSSKYILLCTVKEKSHICLRQEFSTIEKFGVSQSVFFFLRKKEINTFFPLKINAFFLFLSIK